MTVPIAEVGAGELRLTRRERILLLAGLHIACVLISFIERPSVSHQPGEDVMFNHYGQRLVSGPRVMASGRASGALS